MIIIQWKREKWMTKTHQRKWVPRKFDQEFDGHGDKIL